MKFTKMHGLGNDFVFVNCFTERVDDPPSLARVISNRHTGVGSDGLILILPSQTADVRMQVFNADGSRPQMCGNALRCVAKYAVERGLADGPRVDIETDDGVKRADCLGNGKSVSAVSVDMGVPSLAPSVLPSSISAEQIVNHPIRIAGAEYKVTCVSMGNPHAVVYVDNLDAIALDSLGPLFEHAAEFPQRINTHFVRVDSPDRVTMKTWERGSGVTLACGTGACAVCVAGVATERTGRAIRATLPGGDLQVEWGDDDHVHMTGPAVEVFRGDW